MAETLLFLGAGASRPFEIPTMREMVTEFEEWIKKEKPVEATLYSKIRESQQKEYGYGNVDLESVFSVIKGIASKSEPKDMGHLASYVISENQINRKFSTSDIQQATILKTELEKFVKRRCEVKLSHKEQKERYRRSYEALFTKITGDKQGFVGDYVFYAKWRAYTTNYDSVFESFWGDFLVLNDYFVREGDSKNFTFNLMNNVEDQSLIKLHGSLDWFRDEKGIIRRIGTDFTRHEIGGEVMILYPIQQKDLHLNPWITLYQDFKRGLADSNQWIAIGFAFNDEVILEIFIEAFTNQKELIIINPHAKDFRSKFPEELQNKIIPLPIRFGDKYFPEQINDFFREQKTLDIKIKTKNRSDFIGFTSSLPIGSVQVVQTGKITPGKSQITASKSWCEVQIQNPENEEVHFILKVEHTPPYDKDLELKITFNGVVDYEYDVHLYDKFLALDRGNTAAQDQDLQRHLGKLNKIYADSLFVT